MKLTTRFTTCGDHIQLVINNFTTNTDVELQQRSVEYDTIFRKYEPLRVGLLERMPLISNDTTATSSDGLTQVNGDATSSEKTKIDVSQVQQQQQKESDSLLDLLGDGLPVSISTETTGGATTEASSAGLMDLLGGLDMGQSTAPISNDTQRECM